MKPQKYISLYLKPFMMVIKERETDSVQYKTRKTTYVGEFEQTKVNETFEYLFPRNEFMQRPISGKMPDFVATIRAFDSGALIFEKTAYFDKI